MKKPTYSELMQRFSQRNALAILGLVGAVSTSVSWNPEHFFIARSEYTQSQQLDLAQTAADTIASSPDTAAAVKVDPPAQPAQQADAQAPHEQDEIDYNVRTDKNGRRIVTCSVNGKALKDCSVLRNMDPAPVAPGKPTEAPKTAPEKAKKEAKEKSVNVCKDIEDTVELLDCHETEMTRLVDACDEDIDSDLKGAEKAKATSERKKCMDRAKNYYKNYVDKVIQDGLGQPVRSEAYQAALQLRNRLLGDLPKNYTGVKQSLIESTAQGSLIRAREIYNQSLRRSQTPEAAAAAAKLSLQSDLNGNVALNLCSNLVGGRSCVQALQNPSYRQYLMNESEAYQDFSSRFASSLFKVASTAETGPSFIAMLNGDLTSNTVPLEGIDKDLLYKARVDGTRVTGAPITGGVTNLPGPAAGPRVLPSANPFPNQPGQPGFQAQFPNTTTPGLGLQPQAVGTRTIYDPWNPTGTLPQSTTAQPAANYPVIH